MKKSLFLLPCLAVFVATMAQASSFDSDDDTPTADSPAASASHPGALGAAGPGGGGNTSVDLATALPAMDGAIIARIRAQAGPGDGMMTYRTDCGGDVNIASVNNPNPDQNVTIQGVYVQSVFAIDLGRCQELQGPSAEHARQQQQTQGSASDARFAAQGAIRPNQ